MIGQTLLHYRITDRLGAGGMGEVYRAIDTNLNREVAIKVLPPEVVRSRERLGRFRREAQLLAALNHTSIASIHGLEEAGGQPFLVLELVEGEDLKERLARGPIPIEEALEIAKQIAEALEEAHAHGIVHRDLKPANVKLTPDGQVKVLDFGLAKAWVGDTASGTSSLDLSASPTVARSGTLAGVILGTAAYMPPEQAAGRAVDKRADIWSFGVVLFEMLTGRSLFTGGTATEILASVMKDEPEWERVPDGCPPPVIRLLRRCLRKKPRERLQDIGDARLELEEALGGAVDLGGAPQESGAPVEEQRRARLRERVAWAAAVVLGGLAALSFWSGLSGAPKSRPVVQLEMAIPEEFPPNVSAAVSPDGSRVALSSFEQSPVGRIWVRSLDAPDARPLPGTEGAFEGFWSPDGESLGFFVHDGSGVALKRVDLATGALRTISRLQGITWGASWSREDSILLSAQVAKRSGLHTVSAQGGALRALQLESAGLKGDLRYPSFLPDGRRFIFGVDSADDAVRGTWLTSFDAPHEVRLILSGVVRAQFAASGHLLFVRDGTLLAQPFDVARAELTGDPTAIASSGRVFSVSRSGVLVYRKDGTVNSELVWFDREANRLGTVGQPNRYLQIQLSPDEKRVVTEIVNLTGGQDLWTLDLGRGVATRETSHPGRDHDAVWSPDGRELLFSSDRGGDGTMRLHRKRLGSGEPASLLAEASVDTWAEDVAPDGKMLIYLPDPNDSIWALPLTGAGEPELVVRAGHAFDEPQVSPDGRWLAYGAQETGRWEVYLMPFRRDGERVRVSPAGGGQPRWRGDGRELFYLTPEGQLMAVDVRDSGDRLELGLPTELFDAGVSSPISDEYSPAKDGSRFLVITPVEESAWSLHVILNWRSLLD